MLLCERSLQNRLMVGDAIAEQTNLVERSVSLLAQKRCRFVDEESTQVRSPEVGFVLRTEKTYPESEAEFGDESVRLEWLALGAKRLLGATDVVLMRMMQAETPRIIPTGAQCLG